MFGPWHEQTRGVKSQEHVLFWDTMYWYITVSTHAGIPCSFSFYQDKSSWKFPSELVDWPYQNFALSLCQSLEGLLAPRHRIRFLDDRAWTGTAGSILFSSPASIITIFAWGWVRSKHAFRSCHKQPWVEMHRNANFQHTEPCLPVATHRITTVCRWNP